MTGPRLCGYDWRGGCEAMLRFGPDVGPTVLAVLPLFEEANRCRAAMVAVLRRLAAHGIGAALPDLPGTGESLVTTQEATLEDWRDALSAAAGTLPAPVHLVAWRGGTLIDVAGAAASRWYLSPLAGTAQMRELDRLGFYGHTEGYGGNLLSDDMRSGLSVSTPRLSGPCRVARLTADPSPADVHLPGRPLWRAVEPDVDADLQVAVADDIAGWITRCAG